LGKWGENKGLTDVKLTDEQWEKMVGLLREDPRAYVGKESACRRFVEAEVGQPQWGAMALATARGRELE
jgi:uncharacterized membrane protein YcgQ (UPF0703/DUF1980 family)